MALWKPLVVLTGLLCLPATESRQEEGAPIACAMRPAIIYDLRVRYGEHQIDWRLLDENRVAELWVNESAGSYSELITYTIGSSCLVRAGWVKPWRGL